MKKSLFITLEFPPKTGGIANYYANICRHLPLDKIVVLTEKSDGNLSGNLSASYKIIREELISKNPFRWPKWVSLIDKTKKIYRQFSCQCILVGQVLPVGTVAYYIKKNIKIPYYVFTHGMDITVPTGHKKYLIKKILNYADGVFANSNFTKREVIKFGVADRKISVVYPCPNYLIHPANEMIVKIKNKHNLENKKMILTVGRLVERKGQDRVIESLPSLIKKNPALIYVIVGTGPRESFLKNLSVKLNLKDNIIFTGYQTDAEIAAWYEICDCFIMVSRKLSDKDVEGFGTVYLEANSFSKPVIAGKSGGVAEAVQDGRTGLIVDPDNKKEIADAISKIIENPAFAHQLGIQGLDRVHQKFQWPTEAQKIISMPD